MRERVESLPGVKLPRPLVVASCAAGLLMLAVGMSRLLRPVSLSSSLLPMLAGSVIIYASGFKKRLYMDDDGIHFIRAFWGREKESFTAWADINEAKVFMNAGKNIYVLLLGAGKIPPFTFKRNAEEAVLQLLHEKLPAGKVLTDA